MSILINIFDVKVAVAGLRKPAILIPLCVWLGKSQGDTKGHHPRYIA